MANEGRLEELQDAGSRLGRTVLEIGHYNLSTISPDASRDLQLLGYPLHTVETIILTHGPDCVRSIVDTITQASKALDTVVDRMEITTLR